jgi:hypothetical protein
MNLDRRRRRPGRLVPRCDGRESATAE